jgi:selenocysteine-specific elongation factor
MLRLSSAVAAAPGDRFVLRRGGIAAAIGGLVLDVAPARAVSRRRQTTDRVAAFAAAVERDPATATAARLDLHGALVTAGTVAVATDVAEDVAAHTLAAMPSDDTIGLEAARALATGFLRRRVTVRRDDAHRAAVAVIDGLIEAGQLVRDSDRVGLPGVQARGTADDDPELARAMDRLEALLAQPAPPPLREAAARAGCPDAGVRLLARRERIVLLEPDLAYATGAYRGLERQALDLASLRPLTPAAFRDATGTSRKYVMAILEDLDRRGILRRTDAGHVPGPRAATLAGPVGVATARP